MSNTKSTDAKAARVAVSLAAIDQYIEQNIVLPTETVLHGKDRVQWGTGDRYPDYLLDLYDTTPTLASIIDGTVDFIAGDDLAFTPAADGVRAETVNVSGETPRQAVREMAHSLELDGGIAVQVIRNRMGQVAEIYPLDLRFVRTNKENTVFYYCENWQKRGSKVVVYPKFLPITPEEWARLDEDGRNAHASSIYFYKAINTRTYPSPSWRAAVKDCEIERNTTDFHLNSLENGFVPSAIVNFNNGQPDDQMKEEIEREFTEKFSGYQNAGRIIFSWNKNKESATTFDIPKTEDFGERYKALSTHARQQIFASFRAVPALFGIMTESTGFNEQEFSQAFRLYNRTHVRPAQRVICDIFDRIYGRTGVLTITPFTLEGADTQVN